jgi:hypothetical protein
MKRLRATGGTKLHLRVRGEGRRKARNETGGRRWIFH